MARRPVRTLQAGEPELLLGRDADCGVCLPDPQRNVSRRHLSVWLEDDTLRFRVLSVVSGVETPFAEAPPWRSGYASAGTQRLLDRYFAEAYVRESLRIRRETLRPGRKADRIGAG